MAPRPALESIGLRGTLQSSTELWASLPLHLPNCKLSRVAAGDVGKPSVLLPPTERTLAELHAFVTAQWPDAPCVRWEQWSMHLSESPRLRGYEGCSMSLRFLQHCIDAHQGSQK